MLESIKGECSYSIDIVMTISDLLWLLLCSILCNFCNITLAGPFYIRPRHTAIIFRVQQAALLQVVHSALPLVLSMS